MSDKSDREEKEKAMEDVWEATPSIVDETVLADLDYVHKRIGWSIPQKRKSWNNILYRVAAILLLPIIGAVAMYLYTFQNQVITEPIWKEYFVPNGKQDHLYLADGTEVWLNSGSFLLYDENLTGNKRSVYLNGEGSFNVTHDPEKPFIVKTKYIETEVLGTLFNVEAYSNSELIKITLEEGKVKVNESTLRRDSAILIPNEQLTYNITDRTFTKQVVDASQVLKWKHGYLLFNEASVDDILKTIERRFDVTINYETGKYPNRKFNMKFRPNEGLNEVMQILKEMIPEMNYKIKEGIIYVQ